MDTSDNSSKEDAPEKKKRCLSRNKEASLVYQQKKTPVDAQIMVPQDVVEEGPVFDLLQGPGLLEMMAPEAGPSTINDDHQPVDAETYKKKLSLLRNKKAVHLYRQKKKQYVKNLTDHVAMLEKLNSKLKQEIKTLKEIYHKTPGC
uniref:BZIP domain-containing protein n=1 Tax=Gouania willdenowi TaxID=441366 RepID=A0A8C5H658_GOUWI